MGLIQKLLKLFSILLILILLNSCTDVPDEDNAGTNNSDNEQEENETPGKFNTQGRIVKIDEQGLHIQNKGKVDIYEVDQEIAGDFFVGEQIGLNKLDNNKYQAVSNQYYDYNQRHTPEGEPIRRITGTVGDVTDNQVIAVTEMGDIRLKNIGDFDLEKGSQVIFDYIELHDSNELVSFFDEASKINVNIKEISRDTSGTMRIYAVSADNNEYDIEVDYETITNFAHSTLRVGDNIVVYPKEVSGNVPAFVTAKLILKAI